MKNDIDVRSGKLPGGDLIKAVLDRRVMSLADRGGGSGLVGQRWADHCANRVAHWLGLELAIPTEGRHFTIEQVVRLDDTPEIAARAARNSLQNPDLLLVGRDGDEQIIQAADAKFSVETARAKQVSAEVTGNLLALGDLIQPLLENFVGEPSLVDGVFLSPDYPLTHLMFRKRQGIVRATVRPDQVILLPMTGGEFMTGLEGRMAMPPLAEVDGLPVDLSDSLLAALYYFRLARAGIGAWIDSTRPLLPYQDTIPVDEDAITANVRARHGEASSAWDLILAWNDDVERVRSQRAAVEQVAGLPIHGRDLREVIDREAARHGKVPPSANKVRRRIGSWYRGQLRERVGPIKPPVDDLSAELDRVAKAGTELMPELRQVTMRIIDEAVAEAAPLESETAVSRSR